MKKHERCKFQNKFNIGIFHLTANSQLIAENDLQEITLPAATLKPLPLLSKAY